MDKHFYQIALTLLPNVGPVTARTLVSYCGGVEAIFQSSHRSLVKIPGIGPQTARHIVGQRVFGVAEKELRFLERSGTKALFYLDENYPSRLKPFNDSPILLYFKGSGTLNPQRTVGIVGTRKPTTYGVERCLEMVNGLKDYQATIISGLAYGIDISAHRECVKLDIPTIGVLGHGLSRLYPQQHFSVAENMQKKGGLLSEYTHATGPDREHFPMRNRIIAALCDALIVVETQQKGGSIITAKMANNYNKDVFAIPGRSTDLRSTGCNLLIKSHQAALIDTVKDIAYVMRWDDKPATTGIQQQLFVELRRDEKLIVDLLRNEIKLGIDELSFQSGFANSNLAGLLLELEFKGLVRSLPGNHYSLV